MEPFFAQVLGYIYGIDKLPGFATLLGSLLAVCGIFCIDQGSRKRENLEKDSSTKESTWLFVITLQNLLKTTKL